MEKRNRKQYSRKNNKQKRREVILSVVILIAVITPIMLVIMNFALPKNQNINQITPAHYLPQGASLSLGNPNALVKMDVWEDFQCSGCLSYTKKIEPQIIQSYVNTGKVYYTFHVYPFIDGGQGESHDAANAALCAAAQNRFWDYHDMLFANWLGENAGSFTQQRLLLFAQNLGLHMADFTTCYNNKTYSNLIQEDMNKGNMLGVPPTPGIFINGKMVVSSAGEQYIPSYEDISTIINNL